LQTINWSKASRFHNKPLNMSLSYLRDDCHKQVVTHIRESRWFESMYTLQGKTRPTRHVRPAYASCGRSPYVATFCEALTDLDRSHCSWEKELPTQSTARRLTDSWVRTELLSRASQWSRGCKPSSWRWPTTRFTGPITPACDRYVQYLLMGANRTILNRHRRGLQLWRCRLATYPLLNLPTSCLHFPLMAPPSL
jgi:hypothetical protein